MAGKAVLVGKEKPALDFFPHFVKEYITECVYV